jgi:ribosomal-protein-alanine N-acetyltransferase
VSVTLRSMRWWDVEALLPLERRLFPDDPWSAELFWSELAGVPATRWYVVAEDAGEPVGYAGLRVVDVAEVQTLGVAPHRRREGLGSLLLRALLGEAERRGAREVLLEVRADNVAAQRLYAAAGFERLAVRRGYYAGGRVDAIVLRARLRADGTIAP